VRLTLGEVVPADLRLLTSTGLQCEESVLTGESLPVDKSPEPVPAGTGVVVATGPRAEFGRIAVGLGERETETDFQTGLRRFSMLLVKDKTGTLTKGASLSPRPWTRPAWAATGCCGWACSPPSATRRRTPRAR
jgi:E1-E2 ATPase